ncbi:FecR family protein [Chitinophaga sp. MM2321]|uniref:FecR family protein n=1 Tax=Chitinophaga sp. MM2321 TaxID=3137178 RepID=UPI0032D5AAC1
MQISKELIENFLSKDCTAEEAAQVSEYLKDNPALLNEYLGQQEWDETVVADKTEEFWQESWNIIQQQKKKSAVIIRLKQVAVAASLVGVLLTGYLWFTADKGQGNKVAMVQPNYKTITNTTNQAMRIILPDSSVVELLPTSILRYDAPFQQDKRNIYLEGEARFKVAGDVAKPFTVFSNAIATTALGTEFGVTAFPGDNNIKVHLYQGKVVVKSADSMQVRLNKDYYLLPGDEFSYNRITGIAALITAKAAKPVVAGKSVTENNQASVSNWYMFDNQDLAHVFDQLADIYNVPLYYNQADVKGMNFIGRIEKADSLVNILKDIALLNNLSVTKTGKGYTIKKK